MKIRNRIALLIVALFVLGTGTIAAYQPQSKSVTITDDGKVTRYETSEVLVGEFLASNDIRLENKDKISIPADTSITEDMDITIERWAPEVILNLDLVEMKAITKATTVGQFLNEQKVVLGENDTVSPELSEELKDGLKIVVKREKTTTHTREADLPYDVKVETTSSLKPGERKVKQAGVNGLVTRDFEIKYFGGEMISETQVSSLILQEPQTEIILEGAENVITDPKTGKTYTFKKMLNMEATAYTHGPNDRWYGKTASGMPTFVGMVAVDRNTIPLGTRLYVEGYGLAHAGDVGGAVKGNIIDLYMNSEKEARAFGRRARKVYILEDQTINVMAARG